MPANRIQASLPLTAPRISIPTVTAPAGFVMVPAQFFQSQGNQPCDWQRNLYVAAFEQARREVIASRQRLFQRAQVIVLN